MQHNSLFVFDIETVPDTAAVRNLTGLQSDDPAELRAELERYHLEITSGKNAFPRQMFHKVVAISFLEASILRDDNEEYYEFRRLQSNKSDDESEIVAGFFNYFAKRKPRLVSFNGRGFDLPVLKYRAMAYGVQSPALHHSGDKWNSYTSRYSPDWHCDLLESLSDYGASTRCKLNEVCSIMGFPGKFGVDGSKVTEMYENGELDAIRHYCETDVLNTYLVYLRWQQHNGAMSTFSYNTAIENLLAFIDENHKTRPYLKEFGEAWRESCGDKFTLGEG